MTADSESVREGRIPSSSSNVFEKFVEIISRPEHAWGSMYFSKKDGKIRWRFSTFRKGKQNIEMTYGKDTPEEALEEFLKGNAVEVIESG